MWQAGRGVWRDVERNALGRGAIRGGKTGGAKRTSESADNGGIPIFASKNRIVQDDQVECGRSVDGRRRRRKRASEGGDGSRPFRKQALSLCHFPHAIPRSRCICTYSALAWSTTWKRALPLSSRQSLVAFLPWSRVDDRGVFVSAVRPTRGMTSAMRLERRNGPRRVGAQGRIPVSAHGKLDGPLALASTQELSCASSTYSGFQHGTGMVRVLGLLCFGSNVDPQQWK